jgi:hypothetical protein
MGRLRDPLMVSLEHFSQEFASFTLRVRSFSPEDKLTWNIVITHRVGNRLTALGNAPSR